jgi:hypothetical protein
MLDDYPFTVFADDDKGPMFRDFCADLKEARRKAQQMADSERCPFMIFSFSENKQIGSFEPKPNKPLA